MGAVAGQVGSRRETPTAPANRGIAKKSAAGINPECVAASQSCVERARESGFAFVGAGTIGQVAPLAADVVADALDRSALG